MAYVTSVGSSTSVLIEDTPNVVQQSVLGSVQNKTNIAQDLIQTLSNTYAQKVRRAYNYARDKYTYGLPEGTFGNLAVDVDQLRIAMNSFVVLEAGETYEINSAAISPLIARKFAEEAYTHHGSRVFDPTTGLVSNIPLEDMTSPSLPITLARVVDETHVKAIFSKKDDDGLDILLFSEELEITNSLYNKLIETTGEYYYYVEYQIIDVDGVAKGNPKLWNYWENANYYPELNLTDKILQQNQYMPIIPIRVSNKMLYDTDKDKDTEAYRTSKELLNILDLKLDELTKGVKENPDIDQVDHAYVTLGVNVFSEKAEANLYLYEFAAYMDAVGGSKEGNFINIVDETYSTRLVWDTIQFKRTNESIMKVGEVSKQIKQVTIPNPQPDQGDSYELALVIKKQISKTVTHEFSIVNLALFNYIYETGLSVVTGLDAKGQDDEEALCIPLNISIIEDQLSPLEANTVYYDALRIVFNAFDRKKLKWYQTGLFKFVVTVLSIALAVVTGGLSLVNILIAVGVNVAFALLAKYAVQIFGKKVGSAIAAVAAIVLIAVGVMTGYLPDVTSVVGAAISTMSTITSVYLQDSFDALTNEIKEFNQETKDKAKEIDEAAKKLDQQYQLDPLGIYVDIDMYPTQTIDQYFFSKITMPIEYGQATIDIIDNWTELQLTLPEL